MKSNERGITMISLVVTIIVLVIITGVALSQVEDDGVVTEVQKEVNYQEDMIQTQQNTLDKMKNEQLNDWGF